MLQTLLSETGKIFSLFQKNGISAYLNLTQNPHFVSVVDLLQNVSQELIEDNNKIKFDSIFKFGKNVFLPISENEEFNVGIFLIPKGSEIPLHDHPQMLVISKILTGRLNFVSIDFADNRIQMEFPKKLYNFIPIDGFEDEVFCGKINSKGELAKNDLVYLTPDKGNLHQFKAIENSAILDVLVPRYDLVDRFCNFYEFKENGENVSLKYIFPPPDYDCYNLEKPLKF